MVTKYECSSVSKKHLKLPLRQFSALSDIENLLHCYERSYEGPSKTKLTQAQESLRSIFDMQKVNIFLEIVYIQRLY